MTLEPNDLEQLKDAVKVLENPGLAVQITNLIGKPIEMAVNALPESVSRRIGDTTLCPAFFPTRYCVHHEAQRGGTPSNTMHTNLATLTGAVGGAFGLSALAIELPVSTSIILRSMADIARGEGENIQSVETQLACIEVFALGSRSATDDAQKPDIMLHAGPCSRCF